MTDREGFRVDMHVKVLDEEVVERAKAAGLDAIVYAPHFVRLADIRERAAAFSDDELLVVPGRELFTGSWHARKHLLTVGLSEPVPDFITLEGAMTELERQDAVVLAPHPGFLNVSLTGPDLAAYGDRIHGVEAYNLKLLSRAGNRAKDVVESGGWPPFGSSYAHLTASVGEVWTRFDGGVETEADLLRALRAGDPRTVDRRTGPRHTLRSLAEFAHLGYENSWSKIDRLFLQGTEPTHPSHIAYDGRFDDVAVY